MVSRGIWETGPQNLEWETVVLVITVQYLFQRRRLISQPRLQLVNETLQSGTFFIIALLLTF